MDAQRESIAARGKRSEVYRHQGEDCLERLEAKSDAGVSWYVPVITFLSGVLLGVAAK